MKLKLALVGEERREAQRGLTAICPICGDPVIAKCGDIRIWHWAHPGGLTCEPWWEETEWHRGWKDEFPKDCQEVCHRSESGERHIADVKTESGIVLEFQHSFLHREERDAREDFYPNGVACVLPVSRTSFLRAYREGMPLNGIDHSAIAPALAYVLRRTGS